MKVSENQYDNFKIEMSEIQERLERLETKIGNVPMTIRFIRSLQNTLSDIMQMYFEEIKDSEEKALDEKILKAIKDSRG